MDNTDSDKGDVSSAKAVLLGALASGVNGPTWITLKSTFLLLGLCLAVMLGLAFSSSDLSLMLHVGFLVLICVTLFSLLSWFLAQTGLVSIEHQMQEVGLVQNDHLETSRNDKLTEPSFNRSWLPSPRVSLCSAWQNRSMSSRAIAARTSSLS